MWKIYGLCSVERQVKQLKKQYVNENIIVETFERDHQQIC